MIFFLYPAALFGILGIAAPILIHLLRNKRKIVPVPSILLFTSLKRSSPRRKIEDLILLILRCLAVLLISLLLARPYQEQEEERAAAERRTTETVIGILIDDTPLSHAVLDGRSALDWIKEDAAAKIAQLPPDGSIHLASLSSGMVSGALNPKQALALLEKMEIQPGQGNPAAALAELKKTMFANRNHCFASFLVEALPFAATWRNVRPEQLGIPAALFHQNRKLLEQTPELFVESAEVIGNSSGLRVTLADTLSQVPQGSALVLSGRDGKPLGRQVLPAGLLLKNTVTFSISGLKREEPALLTLTGDGFHPTPLAQWHLTGGATAERNRILLLHDGTPATTYPLLLFHAALSLSGTGTIQTLNPDTPQAWSRCQTPPACIFVPTMKSISPQTAAKLSEFLAGGSRLILFAQHSPLPLKGLEASRTPEWGKPLTSGEGFPLAVSDNPAARGELFRLYAKGLSQGKLQTLTPFHPAPGDLPLLNHAGIPFLSLRPAAGGGSIVLWSVPTSPLPLGLAAAPVFPQLLSFVAEFGGGAGGAGLHAGDTFDPAARFGGAGRARIRTPLESMPEWTVSWSELSPAELYFPVPGNYPVELTRADGTQETGNLPVNLKRLSGGILPPSAREKLPGAEAAKHPWKLMTVTSRPDGTLAAASGRKIRIDRTLPTALLLMTVLSLETLLSSLGARRRKGADQC